MKPIAPIALLVASAMLTGMTSAQDAAPAQPAAKPEAAKVSPEQLKKDISYFLGFQSGREMSQVPTLTINDLDKDAFMTGASQALAGEEPSKEQQESINLSLSQFQKEIEARIKAMGEKNLETGKKFLEENGKKDGVVTTKSGLQYKVVTEGKGKKYSEAEYKNPEFSIKYKGTKIDGTVFDQSGDEPVDMSLQVIPGFAEAIKMMPVGSKWTVYIPSDLAYKEASPSPKIGPNETLIFDLEMVDIKEAPEQPEGSGMPNFTQEQIQEMIRQSQAGGAPVMEEGEIDVEVDEDAPAPAPAPAADKAK